MFYYVSPIGVMTANFNRSSQNVDLFINADFIDSYPSFSHLADAVYTFTTGYIEWDILDCKIDNVPSDISEWHQE